MKGAILTIPLKENRSAQEISGVFWGDSFVCHLPQFAPYNRFKLLPLAHE